MKFGLSLALIVSSFAAESDNMDPPQFECACGGGCTDSKPGFMMEDEERKCCKSSGWTDLNISGTNFLQCMHYTWITCY